MPETVEEEISNYLVEFNAAIDKAALEGFEVVRGDARTLLLDLDTPEDKAHFERMFPVIAAWVELKIKDRWPSKSGTGEHVVLALNTAMPATERLLVQAALGSDRFHELLSLVTGIWHGNAEPTVLFRPAKELTCA